MKSIKLNRKKKQRSVKQIWNAAGVQVHTVITPKKILIFVSSSREYVFEAYDVEAFQYLLKPVDDRKLKKVLQKAVLKTESRSQELLFCK